MAEDTRKPVLRILRFLACNTARLEDCAKAGRKKMAGATRGTISVETKALEAVLRAGLARECDGGLGLTAAGRASLARMKARPDPFRAQHGQTIETEIDVDGMPQRVSRNLAESPLSQLARRRARDGTALLSEAEFEAGERLRSDYDRARLTPRITANWDAAIASRRRGESGGLAELTEAALAARQRVEAAMDAVGPELSGILIDVCCFLKGIGQVEAERQWPARSAKIVLKTALAALARHYRPGSSQGRRRRSHHWGARDFRPSLRSPTPGK
jgi:hypothetical protein